jgi:ribosomal protein L37AE/L43A
VDSRAKGKGGKGKGGGGKGKGGGGKGKGGGGKGGNRGQQPPDEASCVAGLDGETHHHVQCYACWEYGHTKSKYQVWNCPKCEDPWAKPDTGGPPPAPQAVVEQVAPPVAAAFDINALFDAVAMNETGVDDATVAMMKEIYTKSANANVLMMRLVPKTMCVIKASMGKDAAPAGQNFKAYVGMDTRIGTEVETIFDDGGSPVNLIGPERAEKLAKQGLARYVAGMSLHDQFTGVVSATGHNLGYQGDIQIDVYPVDGDRRQLLCRRLRGQVQVIDPTL